MPSYDRALHALRTWMDSRAGIGRVAAGMARQGYDLQLTRDDEKGWRATSTRAGWSTRPPAPRARRGSARHGTRSETLRGMPWSGT